MKKFKIFVFIIVGVSVVFLALFLYNNRYYLVEREVEKFFIKNGIELHLQINSLSTSEISIAKLSLPKSKIQIEDFTLKLKDKSKILDFKIESVLVKSIAVELNFPKNKIDLNDFLPLIKFVNEHKKQKSSKESPDSSADDRASTDVPMITIDKLYLKANTDYGKIDIPIKFHLVPDSDDKNYTFSFTSQVRSNLNFDKIKIPANIKLNISGQIDKKFSHVQTYFDNSEFEFSKLSYEKTDLEKIAIKILKFKFSTDLTNLKFDYNFPSLISKISIEKLKYDDISTEKLNSEISCSKSKCDLSNSVNIFDKSYTFKTQVKGNVNNFSASTQLITKDKCENLLKDFSKLKMLQSYKNYLAKIKCTGNVDSEFDLTLAKNRDLISHKIFADINLSNIDLNYDENKIQDLNTRMIFLDPLKMKFFTKSLKIQKLSQKGKDIIKNINFNLISDGENYRLNNLNFEFLKGKFSTGNIIYSKNVVLPFNLYVDKLPVQDVMMLGLKEEEIDATGFLKGIVPVTHTFDGKNHSVQVLGGNLHSESIGKIKYTSAAGKSVANTNPYMKMLFEYLENFDYKNLNFNFDMNKTYDFKGKMDLYGNNPKMYNGRALKFGLNLKFNLMKMLQSEQGYVELPKEIEENLTKKMQN